MKKLLNLGLVMVVLLLAACAPAAPAATSAPEATQPESAPATQAAAAPTEAAAAQPAEEKVFRMAANEPDSLDPTKGGFGYQEYSNLYEPLVNSYTSDGTIQPLAAESFEVSDDGLTITFKLRPDLKWSDGQPLVAEDYRFAWLRQLNPETGAYVAEELFPIKNGKAYNAGEITDPEQVGIQAPDDLTLVVTLEEPSPSFLSYVGDNNFYPVRKDILEKYGDKWMEAGNFVGNGPYMLQEWKHDQKLVMVKNPYYNGPWKDSRNVDRIEYTLMQDAWNQAVPGYEADELDVAIVPPSELDRILNDPELSQQVQQLPISGSVIMIFDTKNAPTDDVRVRQALSMAIDRKTLAEKVLKGAYAPAVSLSPPNLPSYNPDQAPGYAYDVVKAQQLLADAGYPNGQGFPPFELTLWSVEREGLIAQAISAMWKANLGIDIQIQILEPKAMRDWRIARNEQPYNSQIGLNWAGIADPREFHNALFDPENSLKRSRYDKPEYVDLMRAANVELDPDKRAEMYKQAEAIINNDVPIISIIYEARTWLVKPYVKNFDEVTTSVAEMTRFATPPGLDIVK